MEVGHPLAHKLLLIAATTLVVLATFVTADSQDLIFSPTASGSGWNQFDQTRLPESSASTIKQGDQSTKWTTLPRIPFIDLYRDSFGTDFSKNISGNGGFKNPRNVPPTSESLNDKFSFGNSYLGIQTQKKLQTPFWRTDCASDDECADYSGLPKSEPSKRTVKSVRKPFIGLSITTPIQ